MKNVIHPGIVVFLGVTLLLGTGCRPRPSQQRDTIHFVKQLVSDPSGLFSIVQDYSETSSRGAIALTGPSERTLPLVRALLASDIYDNIDGTFRKDGLPDFSGEVIQVILDDLSSPYSHYLATDPDSLRELTVRAVLHCLDTVSYSDPYNAASRIVKQPSKMVVLTSPLQSEYGRFDADTLFKMGNKRLSLIDPVQAILQEVMDGQKDPVHLALWTREPEDAEAAFRNLFKERCGNGATLDILPMKSVGDPDLRDALRSFADRNAEYRLNSLLVDGPGTDPEMIRETLSQIRRTVAEGDQAALALLSGDFRLLDMTEVLVRACYRHLRNENLFTHDIVYPKAEYFNLEESLLGEPVPVRVTSGFVSSLPVSSTPVVR